MLRVIRNQYAALPYRIHADRGLEVLLITSRGTRRWILPKGWPIFRQPWYAATREAFEEAGILGTTVKVAFGAYKSASGWTTIRSFHVK